MSVNRSLCGSHTKVEESEVDRPLSNATGHDYSYLHFCAAYGFGGGFAEIFASEAVAVLSLLCYRCFSARATSVSIEGDSREIDQKASVQAI